MSGVVILVAEEDPVVPVEQLGPDGVVVDDVHEGVHHAVQV